MLDDGLSRRDVLRALGAGVAAGGVTGVASADDSRRFVVGTAPGDGISTASVRANSVERRLDFAERGGAVAGEFDPADAEALAGRSDVRYVERDIRVEALAERLPWGVDRVGADTAHEEGFRGTGADIAVIDTGIDSDHPDLAPNLGEGYAVLECEDGDCPEPWDDDHSHGTHVAGIADAIDNARGVVGVNTSATLHAIKALTAEGSGSASGIAEGITWAADRGYDVVNMSIGAGSSSEVLLDAVRYAAERGVVLVAAAGNDGPCEDCVGYPAAYDEVIAVSSTTPDDGLSEFSSTGSEVELAAPGSDVLSTVIDGYDTFSGTSMATPHVAGAAAQLRAEGHSRTQARTRLAETARTVDLDDTESGNGLVDVNAALGGSGGSDGPTVRTARPTGVGDGTATLHGELLGLGDAAEATCSCAFWRAGRRQSTERTVGATTMTDAGTFETAVEGLETGVEYAYLARAETPAGTTASGGTVTFTPGEGGDGGDGPVVETLTPTDVETAEATLRGEVASLGGAEEVLPGFLFWVAGRKDETGRTVEGWEMDEPGTFEEDAEDLQSGETYVAVAAAVTPDGQQVEGEPVEFTPGDGGGGDPDAVDVETLAPTDVGGDEAELRGELHAVGGYEEVTPGFTYWMTGRREETSERIETWGEDEPTTFEEDAEDLQSGETYAAVAAVSTPDGTRVTGEPVEFTPGDGGGGDDPARLQVTTGEADSIEDDEATLGGEVVATGGAPEVETALTYWPEGDGAAARTEFSGDVTDAATFTDRVVRLSPGTTYAFRAEAWPEGDRDARVTGATNTFTTDRE